ncbi:MAG: nucleotide exchange factor GrpE [Duncaniella sp.]|uniref:nucleotide exchange factor GrpE n=1 Tax=Duncaniella sp. TaxID=2518496 RepID=UPI0019A66B9D|nr:nucleotide exchange factor GrpE [Duncaniella sp.]MBD5334810.1 nucleotide exchange factor GrpE [Bacteroides sp.]MDE6091283.1 nucleotide exchange factor GrpE [Duncaniella sp.]
MSYNPNNPKEKAPQQDDAAIMDDVQEAYDEQNSVEDEENEIINKQLSDIDALNQQLKDAEDKLEKEKKEYLFLMAEFDNFRKRTVKEKSDIIKNASESVLKGLLPIVDDFERGLEASAGQDDPSSIREGMELIYQKLVKFLASNGVKPIESTGKPFDAEYHEAIAMVPVTDESQKGMVIDTPTKGYTINDKVLRHAKVAVGQ